MNLVLDFLNVKSETGKNEFPLIMLHQDFIMLTRLIDAKGQIILLSKNNAGSSADKRPKKRRQRLTQRTHCGICLSADRQRKYWK